MHRIRQAEAVIVPVKKSNNKPVTIAPIMLVAAKAKLRSTRATIKVAIMLKSRTLSAVQVHSVE